MWNGFYSNLEICTEDILALLNPELRKVFCYENEKSHSFSLEQDVKRLMILETVITNYQT